MNLAFTLYKYFPFGGLQRDFLRIAQECRTRGHQVTVYTLEWQGETPKGITVQVLTIKRWSNHARYEAFYYELQARLARDPVDLLVGFNKMPGLDMYYAADPCYQAKMVRTRGHLSRIGGRYRHFVSFEAAVFGSDVHTIILMLSEAEVENFVRYYHTPPARFLMLPPGISRDRMAGEDAPKVRQCFRKEFQLEKDEKLILMVGSGFKTKGLDRAICGLAALPFDLRKRTRLFVVGQDNPAPFRRLAKRLKVLEQMQCFSGRNDIPRFLLGADLLIHPAYSENSGMVLLEAMISGLPVLATDICGYASHIEEANAGKVLPSPFRQQALNQQLEAMLISNHLAQWSNNGIAYGLNEDLYSMPNVVVEQIEAYASESAHDSS